MQITLALDPRFPGGTSNAVAREIPELMRLGHLRLAALSSRMLRPFPVNPSLETTLADEGLDLSWNDPVISSDVIVLHNPSFLKFDERMKSKLVCDTLIVVSHENFLGPDGQESFDISHCLDLVHDASLCRRRIIAPVSNYNRKVLETWLSQSEADEDWEICPQNWHNICEFELDPPTPEPRDRRGRHSRAGFEKFPRSAAMELMFPPTAEYCGILGGDTFIEDAAPLPHWQLFRFREIPVQQFLNQIDFFVYFTNERWRESFGRVIAEAIAAGKLVLTDAETASTFGKGVIATTPGDVDDVIANYIKQPAKYINDVCAAQAGLEKFSARSFRADAETTLRQTRLVA